MHRPHLRKDNNPHLRPPRAFAVPTQALVHAFPSLSSSPSRVGDPCPPDHPRRASLGCARRARAPRREGRAVGLKGRRPSGSNDELPSGRCGTRSRGAKPRRAPIWEVGHQELPQRERHTPVSCRGSVFSLRAARGAGLSWRAVERSLTPWRAAARSPTQPALAIAGSVPHQWTEAAPASGHGCASPGGFRPLPARRVLGGEHGARLAGTGEGKLAGLLGLRRAAHGEQGAPKRESCRQAISGSNAGDRRSSFLSLPWNPQVVPPVSRVMRESTGRWASAFRCVRGRREKSGSCTRSVW
jgi:hypothetical protein